MPRLRGLVAAPHTPFDGGGRLLLDRVAPLAAHLAATGVSAVFVAGSTGEWPSLTVDERLRLARRWIEVGVDAGLPVVVHVGHHCLDDARVLATDAQAAGADGIATLVPSFFRPPDVHAVVDWCAAVAATAPELPFYYYDIPALTGVVVDPTAFLDGARAAVPTLAGVKFTRDDPAALEAVIAAAGDDLDVLFGCDEKLLDAWRLGVRGAVGSSYNYAAPLYRRVIEAAEAGDLEAAEEEQRRAARMIDVLAAHGYTSAAKQLMARVGVDVGATRPPLRPLTEDALDSIVLRLAALGVPGAADWARDGAPST